MYEKPLDEKPLYRRNYQNMQETLMTELKLCHPPVAVKFFYAQIEVDYFKKWHDYHEPTQATPFCTLMDTAHLEKQIIYLEAKTLGCDDAKYRFNWQDATAQASNHPRQQLQHGVLGIAIAPLTVAQFVADTVHCYCTKAQADELIDQWTLASGAQPLEVNSNSASCADCVLVHNKNLAKISPACCSRHSASEDAHLNVILPGDHLKHVIEQLSERRISLGSSSLNRPGDGVFRFSVG
ncbi:DUF169 domain-containing protein [Desulfotalea psychrophila]|uniref:Uncharacterized protein n=1 Tax=Desulfotalea psychrophila (strain LSv54 / DSM 12343) TaxID=177439 RepID=Q6APE4_DESPS|nr:DUF169 domain-containing protein [Desulfotalea psychrophila]CAG35780.1 hypothetical protein DP1051 [Desulfotalea psychrophila LSv54]